MTPTAEKLKSDWKILNLPIPGIKISLFGWYLGFHVLSGGDVLYLNIMPDE